MKQLRKEFEGVGEVKGYSFKQIKSIKDKVYVYEVTNEKTTHYEVFKHVENERFNCISYPRSPAFGVWAWSCGGLGSVNNTVNRILDNIK